MTVLQQHFNSSQTFQFEFWTAHQFDQLFIFFLLFANCLRMCFKIWIEIFFWIFDWVIGLIAKTSHSTCYPTKRLHHNAINELPSSGRFQICDSGFLEFESGSNWRQHSKHTSSEWLHFWLVIDWTVLWKHLFSKIYNFVAFKWPISPIDRYRSWV